MKYSPLVKQPKHRLPEGARLMGWAKTILFSAGHACWVHEQSLFSVTDEWTLWCEERCLRFRWDWFNR